MNPAIETNNLVKRYGSVTAVDGLSLRVDKGEIYSFLDLNGAGGRAALPGNYVYGNHRMPYEEAGLWGLFRVYPRGAAGTKLAPLPAR